MPGLTQFPATVSQRHIPSVAPGARDLLALLAGSESSFGDRDFLISDRRLTFAKAGELSRRAAARLAGAGVRAGDRVMLCAANDVDVILIALAAWGLGAIVALLHEGTTERNFKRVVHQIRPSVVVFDRSTIAFKDLIGDSVGIGLGPDTEMPGIAAAHTLFSATDAIPPRAEVAATDPVCLVFTSGSSGEPRGVVVSHDNVVFTTAAIQERVRYRPDDTIGLFVPLSFDYGLYQIFLAANVGASVYIAPPNAAGPSLLRVMDRHEISVFPAVPTLIGSLLKLLDRGGETLKSLRCITSTGDHLPVPHIQRLQQRLPAAEIFPMYGLTECKRVSILLPDEIARKPETVGRPLTGTSVRAVSPTGNALPAGTTGELVVSGRHVTLGYWKAKEATERRFRVNTETGERELWTGDVGEVDKDGFIRVLGRNDALLKHLGFRISSAEIEIEACCSPSVVEAGVVCSTKGELHLFVRLSGENDNPAEIRQLLRDQLEWFKVPERVHVVNELPRTLNGKTDRAGLKAMADAFDAQT